MNTILNFGYFSKVIIGSIVIAIRQRAVNWNTSLHHRINFLHNVDCRGDLNWSYKNKAYKQLKKNQFFVPVLNVTASQTNVTIVEGSTTTLQCNLTYSKAINVSIFWLFDGKKIKSRLFHNGKDQDLITTHALNPLSLELTRVTRKQSGIYTCGALSAGLRSSLNISVNVTDAEGPELARIGKAVQVFEKGNTASLGCNAVFPPASFVNTFWTFNGGRIASNERRRKDDKDNPHSPGSTLRLTMYDVGLNDTGIYACNLNTSHGMAQKNFSIFVKPKCK